MHSVRLTNTLVKDEESARDNTSPMHFRSVPFQLICCEHGFILYYRSLLLSSKTKTTRPTQTV